MKATPRFTQCTRSNGRLPSEIRPISIETGTNRYAEGSALIRCGNTHVLCTASVEESVPAWLKGKGQGWITAEYSMLPRATHTRSKRDREKISGRTQEIQRLIARALRTMVDLKTLGERSILVDCDVLQADGGTRTASITGGCVAVAMALARLQKLQLLSRLPSQNTPWLDTVAAISVGLRNEEILVDVDYEEDSSCEVDMNFVMTGGGLFVEAQGTAERQPFSIEQLKLMAEAASKGIKELNKIQMLSISQMF